MKIRYDAEVDVLCHQEDLWVTVGRDCSENILVVVHTFVQENGEISRIRIISARKATKKEIEQYKGETP